MRNNKISVLKDKEKYYLSFFFSMFKKEFNR
jgi:hypothetical protein